MLLRLIEDGKPENLLTANIRFAGDYCKDAVLYAANLTARLPQILPSAKDSVAINDAFVPDFFYRYSSIPTSSITKHL